MSALEKAPRWFILLICICAISLASLLFKVVVDNAYADITQTKVVAYEAQKSAETAQLQIAELRAAVQDIKRSSEQFRVEYRQDQKDMDKKLDRLLSRV